jgi:hypothetical protein
MDKLLAGQAALPAALMGAFIVVGYLATVLDRRRETSPSRDDTQVGIKLVLFGFVIVGFLVLTGGLEQLFAFILGGFKPTMTLKLGLAGLLTGGVVAAAAAFVALPRTNNKAMPQIERYAFGTIAAVAGLGATMALHAVLTGVFTSAPWKAVAGELAQLFAHALVALFALTRHGGLSGWGRAAPPQGYPQPGYGQGFPPTQQGFPSGQQGFPPQGGYGGR